MTHIEQHCWHLVATKPWIGKSMCRWEGTEAAEDMVALLQRALALELAH